MNSSVEEVIDYAGKAGDWVLFPLNPEKRRFSVSTIAEVLW